MPDIIIPNFYTFMERFPALSDVVADTGLDDEMIQLAKDALAGKLPC